MAHILGAASPARAQETDTQIFIAHFGVTGALVGAIFCLVLFHTIAPFELLLRGLFGGIAGAIAGVLLSAVAAMTQALQTRPDMEFGWDALLSNDHTRRTEAS